MANDINKELLHVMIETLQAALSPDKNLIDQAQQQLKLLQVRPGSIYLAPEKNKFLPDFNNKHSFIK
jgi:hypothetical protein